MFYLGVLYLILQISQTTSRSKELVCVIEFNRHGARTSKSFSSQTLSKVFGSNMMLTPNGFRQHEMLGQFMRNKYILDTKNFLSQEYSKYDFIIFSTPIQRTISSAIGYLNGFYPNYITKMLYQNNSELSEIINNDTIPFQNSENFLFNEIPIHIFSKANDIFHRKDCFYKGNNLEDLLDTNKEIFNFDSMNVSNISKELGKFLNIDPPEEENDIENGNYLSDLEKYLQSFLYHYGKSLDDPTLSKEIIKIIRMKCLQKKYSYRIEDSKYLRMLSSEIFIEILNYFEKIIYNPLQYKMIVFTAHDSNLMNLLSNLLKSEVIEDYVNKAVEDQYYFDFLFPPYASTILFELYKTNNNEFIVNINYNGKLLNKDLKYINNDKIINGDIKYNDFKFMLENLICKDYKKLICNGIPVDKSFEEKFNFVKKEKKDYQEHFLKRIRRK